MKKINLFLILVLCCCSITPLFSQIRWYAEGGLNYSLISDYESSKKGELYSTNPDIFVKKASQGQFKNEIGEQFALGASLYKNQFNFDFALEYSNLNFGFEGKDVIFYYPSPTTSLTTQTNGQLRTVKLDVTFNYLSLPLIANVSVANNLFSFGAGIVPQLLLDTKYLVISENAVREFGCALQAQVKWQISSQFSLIGVFRQNATTLFNSDYPVSSESKNRTIRLSWRYYFGKKV